MSEVVLNAEVRTEIGSKANRLRYQGKVPGIFYSHKLAFEDGVCRFTMKIASRLWIG